MINRQQNNGDILGYRPDLTIQSNPNISIEENIYYNEVDTSNSKRSIVVRQFEMHSPSKKIFKLNNLKNDILNYKDNIKKSLSNHQISADYFSASNDEKREEILKRNSNDMIDGSTMLEAYSVLDILDKEVSSVSDKFTLAIYGKDVDTDVIAEIDSAYVDKISTYEDSNEYEMINYLALYYDTQISFLVGEYADRIEEAAIELNLLNEEPYDTEPDNNTESVLQVSFDSINEQLNRDLFKDSNSLNSIGIALKNIFITKQNLNLFIDTFSNLFNLGLEYEVVQDIKDSNIKNLDLKLDNLIKTIMLSALNKADIVDTLEKKSKIRRFFTK